MPQSYGGDNFTEWLNPHKGNEYIMERYPILHTCTLLTNTGTEAGVKVGEIELQFRSTSRDSVTPGDREIAS